MTHLKRWGAVYILGALFLGSWAGQAIAMSPEIQTEGWIKFWSATLENWQSEWLQLLTQALLVVALAPAVFYKGVEDLRRIERRIDLLSDRAGPPDPPGPVKGL